MALQYYSFPSNTPWNFTSTPRISDVIFTREFLIGSASRAISDMIRLDVTKSTNESPKINTLLVGLESGPCDEAGSIHKLAQDQKDVMKSYKNIFNFQNRGEAEEGDRSSGTEYIGLPE
jgi:hypothetical protein